MGETQEKIAAIVAGLGSIFWLPQMFDVGMLDILGQTGGTMAGTVLALVGVFVITSNLNFL